MAKKGRSGSDRGASRTLRRSRLKISKSVKSAKLTDWGTIHQSLGTAAVILKSMAQLCPAVRGDAGLGSACSTDDAVRRCRSFLTTIRNDLGLHRICSQ